MDTGAERRLWEAEARRHVRENGLRPVLMPVPRIDAKDLPLQRFREEFALPRRPGERFSSIGLLVVNQTLTEQQLQSLVPL